MTPPTAMPKPMLFLSFVWLALVVAELARYDARWFTLRGSIIWGIFVLYFSLEFAIAPVKVTYLRKNWLTALPPFALALRLLRIARLVRALHAARAVRGLRIGDFSASRRSAYTARRNRWQQRSAWKPGGRE